MPNSQRGNLTGVVIAIAAVVHVLVTAACERDSADPPAAGESHQAAESAPVNEPPIASESIEKSLAAAQSYLDSQEIEKAQAILVTLVDRAPREPHAREMLGQVYVFAAAKAQKRGDETNARELHRQAYEHYRTATELSPNSAGLHHSAGLVALQAGKSNAALEHFQTAERLDPHNPQYPLFAAQVLIQAQRLDEAKAALKRVLALDPDEAAAHASLAMIALQQNQFDSALVSIAEARRINPQDLGLRMQEAKIHRHKGDPRRALELLIGLGPADRAQEMIAFEIAASFDQLGKPMDAARAWQHVFQFDQTGSRAWLAAVRTGEYLLKAGEREQAALWLQQAQFAAPNAPEVIALEEALRKPNQ